MTMVMKEMMTLSQRNPGNPRNLGNRVLIVSHIQVHTVAHIQVRIMSILNPIQNPRNPKNLKKTKKSGSKKTPQSKKTQETQGTDESGSEKSAEYENYLKHKEQQVLAEEKKKSTAKHIPWKQQKRKYLNNPLTKPKKSDKFEDNKAKYVEAMTKDARDSKNSKDK